MHDEVNRSLAVSGNSAFFKKVVKRSHRSSETISRRSFIKLSGFVGGGLVLGVTSSRSQKAYGQESVSGNAEISPFVQIQADGVIKIFAKNPECGQGIKTGLPLIIAEELDALWEEVVVEQAPVNAAVYGPQLAGGSMSTPMNWDAMRMAGATARAMILEAAAQTFDVNI